MNSHEHHRAMQRELARAAAAIGVGTGQPLAARDLAHLAWHCGVIEPALLPALLAEGALPRSTPDAPPCRDEHLPEPDPLDSLLPLPHPLDYEWRYSPRTRRSLAELVSTLAGPNATVALLGTPTLVPLLAHQVHRLLLVDGNQPALAALTPQHPNIAAVHLDLTTEAVPPSWRHRADVVVCDPPWYPPAAAAFLAAASHLARAGATVLLSVPDRLVRPSVDAELEQLAALADQLGLTELQVDHRLLRYRTPFFEYQAQRAAGLTEVPLDWRVGTLWTLRRQPRPFVAPPTPKVFPPSRYAEVPIAAVRFRVITTPIAGPVCGAVVDGDVLPTVSSRHPARSLANVWTTGNSVLATSDPPRFLRQLRIIATGPAPVASNPTPDGLFDEIVRIIGRERAAFEDYRQLCRDMRLRPDDINAS